MHIRRSLACWPAPRVGLIFPLAALSGAAQAPTAATEIPMQRCDQLPVVILQVDKEEKRFRVDPAATSFLNAKSFIGGHAKEVQIHSWNETTDTSRQRYFYRGALRCETPITPISPQLFTPGIIRSFDWLVVGEKEDR